MKKNILFWLAVFFACLFLVNCDDHFLWLCSIHSHHTFFPPQFQVLDEDFHDKKADHIKIMDINTQLIFSNSWDNSLNPISSLYIFARGISLTALATVTKGAGLADGPIPHNRFFFFPPKKKKKILKILPSKTRLSLMNEC